MTPTNDPNMLRPATDALDTPEFRAMMENEFPEDAAEWLDPVTRRKFVTLMGASLALAGAVGCNPSLKPAPAKKVIPYVKKPEGLTPGVPLFFPTAYALGGLGLGVLVKSAEGRPIKVEGNPSHPASLGSTDIYAQGTVLQLYDPDRSATVRSRDVATTWDKARAAIAKMVEEQKGKKGAGLRILTEATTSPTFIALVAKLKERLPEAKWIQYEPVSRDNVHQGAKLAFGSYVNAVYQFAEAKVILALDADFLANGAGGVRYARDAMSRRKLRLGDHVEAGDGVRSTDELSRIYAVESMPTGSGGVADHRIALKPSEVESFVRALAKKLGVADVPPQGSLPELAVKWIDPLAADLLANKGKAVVVPGDQLTPAAHALCHAINAKLDGHGKTVTFTEPVLAQLAGPDADAAADMTGSLKKLVADMDAGKVDALLMFGVNPVYTAPADLEFAKALEKVKFKLHHGLYHDETAVLCDWHTNEAHYLEAWGDVRAYDGTATIQQPLIAPLHNGKSSCELLAAVLDEPQAAGILLVKATWQASYKGTDFDGFWHASVEQGVVAGTASKPISPALNVSASLKASPPPATVADGLELQFRPDPTIYDGRFANVGWLQELPKPITKLTWDNAAIVSPATAEKLKITNSFPFTGGENGRTEANKIEVKVAGRTLKIAAFVLPGHADDAITIHLGYGRVRAGFTGNGPGSNAYAIRTTGNMWAGGGIETFATREKTLLACTQGQHAMEGRRPARHGTVEAVKADAEVKSHAKHAFDFADNPPATSAEKNLMRPLLPGTPEERERLHKDGWLALAPDQHEHEHDHKHDERMLPLTLIADRKENKQYRRWAMAIDLAACTGCSVCIAACVAENNIPVVGKEEVTRGRAMHWIRVDRYFSITEELGGTKRVTAEERYDLMKRKNVEVATHFMPLNCQQCEKAPCEVVCPVGATVHSADGLNDMVYNRCVGTRYCSNNCPYKVRRFNFLQYSKYADDTTLKLVNNPEVTVRTRGVMEKCTYCVQRIRNAEIEAEREHDNPRRPKATMPDGTIRPVILEGEIVTACQAACPSKAISFGDLNYDQYIVGGVRMPMSEVARWKYQPTNYGLLAELNTMPRTSYLAAVKNPNPNMPKGA